MGLWTPEHKQYSRGRSFWQHLIMIDLTNEQQLYNTM